MKRVSYIEIVLALSFLFMLAGVLYSFSKEKELQESKKEILATESEIVETMNYKKSWEGRKIDKKIRDIKRVLPASAISEYQIGHKKARIRLKNVEINAINRFLVKLSSLPIQFITLNVKSSGEKYSMECRCKW